MDQKNNADEPQDEYLTRVNPGRFVMFPIKHVDIWESFQTHRKANWVESEVDLVPDLAHWPKLNDKEQHFIKMVLAFFAASDGIIMENLGVRFMCEVQIPEARAFYSFQLMIENVHSLMYSRLLDTYVTDVKEKKRLFTAIETIPSIKKKGEWALKWIESQENFAVRLVAFAAVEGIFFSGSFCCIYWLNEAGVMPGLCKSNEFIARDEGMHTDFACLLYNKYIENRLTDDMIHGIISEAVAIETEFITEALPWNLLGMNAPMMIQYIKYVANRLVLQLGHTELYPEVKQPFKFMDRICLDGETNFFEGRVSDYQSNMESINLDDMNFSNGDF